MAQLSVYLDKGAEKKARAAAKREGKSLSSWAREKLNAAVDEQNQWPEEFFNLFGSITDDSFRKQPNISVSLDSKRIEL